MTFKEWVTSYIGRPVRVVDLIDLATVQTNDSHTLLTSLYTWKYEHVTTTAKALAGAGSALGVATLVPLVQSDAGVSVQWGWIFASWIAGGVLILAGVAAFTFARRIHSEFVAAQAILSDLIEIRPFLRLVRTQRGSS
jgi:hypothetical protein